MAKYSYSDVAGFAAKSVDSSGKYTDYYRSLNDTQRRYVRAYRAGDFPKDPNVSRGAIRGHANIKKGEKPLSVVKQEKKKLAPVAGTQKQKPAPKPAPKPPVARRNLGQYVRHKRNEKGEIIRSRVNARSEESLGRQIDRVSDSRHVIFHLINQRTGEEVRAIPNKGVTAGDLKDAISDGLAQGKTQKEATRDALSALFRFYAVDIATGVRTSDELDGIPDDISNFVMYAE